MLTYYVSPRRLAHRNTESRSAEVHIPVDVVAQGDEYIITAFVPGVAPEDVNIEVLADTISISGEFPAAEWEDARTLLQERPTGHFARTLRLPTEVDASKAEAEVKHGILSLRVPKAEAAKAKQIKVKTK